MPMNQVVLRYPVLVRTGMSLVCLLLVVAIARSPVRPGTVAVTIVALCLDLGVLAYRTEIDAKEIRVRRAPFWTRSTPMQDVTHLGL
jgi:hypothetical protein